MLISKPWGSEELLELNESYMMKRLTMKKGHRCSLQYHREKVETIYVLSGALNIYIGKDIGSMSSTLFGPGDSVTIMAGVIHRMEAIEDCIYLESSTPEIDDVVRISDDYSRG